MRRGYTIIDEPRPGALSHLSVAPYWILLAGALGGSFLAYPWFVVNSFAIGSARRAREVAMVIAGVVGAVALSLLILWLRRWGITDGPNFKYAFVTLILFRLSFFYMLQLSQARSFELYQHFGGRARNGLPLVIVGAVVRAHVVFAFDSDLWAMVVS